MEDNLKEKVLELLKDGKSLDFIEITRELNLSRDMDSHLANILQEMVNDYDLTLTNKGRYMLFSLNEKNKNYVKGKFMDTKGSAAFVRVDGMDDDIHISSDRTSGALNGDTVLVYIIKDKRKDYKAEGQVVRIISRDISNKVGEIYHFEGQMMVSLDDKRFKKQIYLPDNDETKRLVDGDKVVVSFEGVRTDRDKVFAKFVKRLGHINDPGIDILSMVAEHEIETDFSSEYLEQLKEIPTEVREIDLIGRCDYRKELIYTIDGDDTKDIDDAISIKKLDNGNYLLGVHIADVTYYIKEDSPIDLEARQRATSGYFANTVNPMYHHQLSNGICSLNPNVDRLTISYIEEIDPKGKCISSDVKLGVIHSRKQMTYKNVNKILEENIVPAGYEEYADNLRLGYELADILIKDGLKRGSVDFDTNEPKMEFDKDGKVLNIERRYQGKAEKMIEMFMIRANVGIGNILYYAGVPSIYRDHGLPDEERLNHFFNLIASLGINIKNNIKNINSKVIQQIVEELKKYPEYRVLATKLLSCMDKAIYSSENLGHFALALKIYLHFTSPIRRYADTTVHRSLHKFILSNGMNEENIEIYKDKYRDIGIHCSMMERVNDECERDVDKMKMAEYMEDFIDNEYVGMISGVRENGFYVQLDNMIEGFVRSDSFNQEYHYDAEIEFARVGNKKFKLGQLVTVKVIRASKMEGQIDFTYVGDVDEEEKIKKKN